MVAVTKEELFCYTQMYFVIGFQLSKHFQIFFGSKSANMTQKTTKDIYMCGLYIPPITSNYFDPEIFEELEKDILNSSSKGSIFLLSDFNTFRQCL